MVTLALDTSHPTGAAALARDGVVLGEIRFDQPSSHLVELSRAVEHLLSAHGLTPREIGRVAVVLGPGSFTGVRIALSFAKGLAASGTEVVGMESLRLLALPLLNQGMQRVCAMIDAKRDEVYAAVYQRAEPGPAAETPAPFAADAVVAACAQSPLQLLDSLPVTPDAFVGTGALAHRETIAARFPDATVVDGSRALPSTAYFASIGHLLPVCTREMVRGLEPIYLRPSGAERVRLRSHARPSEKERDG